MIARTRRPIANPDDPALLSPNPAAEVGSISGIRIYDVGQGDSICVLDERGQPFLQIDYGGLQGHPFSPSSGAADRMPLEGIPLLLLTHWDKDHWWATRKNAAAASLRWLVPRQTTSPAAALFAAGLEDVRCIPEKLVGQTLAIECLNGDKILFEKLRRHPKPGTRLEDCNKTGVAFSIVKAATDQVILLPGDSHFHKVGHYSHLRERDAELRGLIAFHHGSGVGWTRDAKRFLSGWTRCSDPVDVVFSYAEGNPYGHPQISNYSSLRGSWRATRTPELRDRGQVYMDILF